jgi:TPR repeat protein
VKYSVGSGVPQDQAAAESWLRLAADQDDPDAQILLAWISRHGPPSAKYSADAVRRLREAADHGSVSAQSSLGEMYRDGEGVPQDMVMAYLWFNLAASAANSQDQERNSAARDNVAAKMTSRQFADAQRLAREWKPGAK